MVGRRAGILWLCASGAVSVLAQPLELVRDGGSGYSIAISAAASLSERRGAEELQKFLEEISVARLPVVTEDAARGDLVLVGGSKALERLGVNIPFGALGPEGFMLRTAGRNLIIAGGRQRGTMYGVYAFLEKLGCRWFTAEVSRIPKMRTIRVGPLNETQKPAFEYREPFFTEAFDKDWAARNRSNGQSARLDESTGGKIQYFPFVHSFYQMIPPEKYFREHPEYFSWIDGARVYERGQLCLTNPEVLKVSVGVVLGWIRQHPEAGIISVSQNDWEGWCECDTCRRVEREEGGQHSGPLLRFVNALAAEVEKEFPDKLIDTLAYWYTETPPLKTRPRRNVRIRLCPIGVCEAHPYEKCGRNGYFIKNLRAWSQVTNQLYIWHYNTNFSNYLLPFPDFDELAADIPMYRRHGVVGLFLEGAYPKGGGGENAELRSYVTAKLMWDTHTDVNEAVNEFLSGVYGKAARPMRAYFDLLQRQVRLPPEGNGQHIWIRRSPSLSPQVIAEARELFRQASAAADDDAVRKRVRKAQFPVEYADLVQSKVFAVRDGSYGPADLAGLRDRFRTFLNELKRFGLESIHEGRNLDSDEQELASLRTFPVATLENAVLRVDVVPELSGRIIRMIDKRTGYDGLRRPEPGERGYPDAGGLRAAALPDSHEREWPVKWVQEPESSASQIVLRGACANGIRLQRTLALTEDGVLRTRTTAENGGAEALDVVLQSSAEVNPGSTDDPHLALTFRKQDGTAVDLIMINTGLLPTGTQSYIRQDRPDGEWRIEDRRSGMALVNRFEKTATERCQVRWRARGENIVTMTVWSQKRKLAPGETQTLASDYAIRPVGGSR